MSDFDDNNDDEHLCIKCNATVHGMQNYIAHRKTQCGNTSSAFALKADDFFSSLELQSSSKKAPSTSGGKTFSGILTRSKTSAVIHAQAQSSSSKSGENAWIGGHQLRDLGDEDNHAKLIKAVDNLSRHVKDPLHDTAIEHLMVDHHKVSDDEDSDTYAYDDDDDDEEEQEEEEEEEEVEEDNDVDDDDEEEDEDVPRAAYTGGKWMPEWEHSGGKGKWKPGHVPPPGHTRGKWRPTTAKVVDEPAPPTSPKTKRRQQLMTKEDKRPFRKVSGGVQYWCNICNRVLSSKIVFERHLRSKLHKKRVANDQERELELDGRKPIDRPSLLIQQTTTKPNPEIVTTNGKEKRSRRKTFVKCRVCGARVAVHLMGKHLISHYHCRKGDIRSADAQRLVLDHIHDIVLESPFQCSACRFYCNTQEDFLRHWKVQPHFDTADGVFTCALCKFTTSHSAGMQTHLVSDAHVEVVAVVNRSVPIVIGNPTMIACATCSRTFISNLQLRLHCERTHHPLSHTATDAHQARHPCSYCPRILRTTVALQRHLKRQHDRTLFFCTRCQVHCRTVDEITAHRKSVAHRRGEECRTHSEENECTAQHRCDQCTFGCDSLAEILFHKALHTQPIQRAARKHYRCSICDKYFAKNSLRAHLQNHTNEKTFECTHCAAKFARKNNWLFHMKKHQGLKTQTQFLCATCGIQCANGTSLKKHMLIHNDGDLRVHHQLTKSFECDRCDYRGKTRQQLNRHVSVHDVRKKYKCKQCPFTCRLSFHLRRHERIHSGVKPYACPHCDYRCNNSENLRKHVLATNKHPDKYLYECKLCTSSSSMYRTNLASEFKTHLMDAHHDIPRTTQLCTNEATSSSTSTAVKDDMFPMYVIAKDDVVYVDKEAWCIVANFGGDGGDHLFQTPFP